RRTVRVEALEQLNVRRHNNGRGPVLHSQAKLVARFPALNARLVDGSVMFEDDFIAENLAKNGGRLVDDRGEGDRVDDPIEIVPLGVLQCEGERSEGLAAA